MLDDIRNCLEPAHGSPPMAINLLETLKYSDETFSGVGRQANVLNIGLTL
jgi:hypothetical protein